MAQTIQEVFASYQRTKPLDEFILQCQEKENKSPIAEQRKGIHVMTMHASKGLEFQHVYLPDLNEGIIPPKDVVDAKQIEEERRLMYVAMTRAREHLYLSYVKQRFQKEESPSRFLKEIEKIVKEKGKDHLNELEELCYVIEKGNECDRIKMTRVGQIMKEKYDKFMEDMNLREEAWAYEKAEFDKIAHYVDGEAKGKVEKSKSHVIKFYKTKYPNEDISWLENLTEKQYDEIFDMLLNNEDLEVIKRIIGK